MKQSFWDNLTQKQRFALIRHPCNSARISNTYAFKLSNIDEILKLPMWLQNSGLFYFWDKKTNSYIY